ncbi:MAG: hypothetical protein ACRD3P_10130 [Terriglobales bacterium]
MIPAGYMAKRVSKRPDWLRALQVSDVYSVSGCVSEDFADYINYWKHNGYWFFNSPDLIRSVAQENGIDLSGTSLFYYEVYEKEFDGENWLQFEPEASFRTDVMGRSAKVLGGFDVVNFTARTTPECSPLSCNSMAEEIRTNAHCLLPSFDEAYTLVNDGAFNNSEPGPYRIFAVYSTSW